MDELLCASEERIVRPGDAYAENCPVLTKQRTVYVDKGVAAVIEWEFRDANGNPVDLSACVEDDDSMTSVSTTLIGSAVARFREAIDDSQCNAIYESPAVSSDPASGVLRFLVPEAIADKSGIYALSVGILNESGKLMAVNNGLLSVERGLFGDLTQQTGPPTLLEMRLVMRDSVPDNSLLDGLEYSDSEIVHALSRPLREFNETPPPLTTVFRSTDFPWREHWLKASVGYLMTIAADSYLRNKMQSAHGGITIDDKNKDVAYRAVAELLLGQWRTFLLRQKATLNAAQAIGDVTSFYGGGLF